MKAKVLVFVVVLFCFGCSNTTVPDNNISDEHRNLFNWMAHFFIQKKYDEVPDKLVEFSKSGFFDLKKRNYIFIGFCSTVFRDNPKIIPDCLAAVSQLPIKHIQIIRVCQVVAEKENPETLMRELHQTNKLSDSTVKEVQEFLSLDEFPGIHKAKAFMEMQWGVFMASGEKEPIRKITELLKYGKFYALKDKYIKENREPISKEEKENLIKSVIFHDVVWALKVNVRKHPIVKQYCEELCTDEDTKPMVKFCLENLLPQT